MNKRKLHDELTILEAVDNLSTLAELDQTNAFAEEDESKVVNKEVVKETFRTLRNYLQQIYEKDKGQLKDIETQKGIQAIMVLAGEAAQKVDRFTSLFKDTSEGIAQLKEYQDLQQFFLTKIMKRFHHALATEEEWEAQWGNMDEESLDLQRRGLKDLETVRRDKEYELFFIQKDDGRPFFNRNLLRHIKLVGHFDESIFDLSGEDPFLRVKIIQDKDVHTTARTILGSIVPYLDEFYKDAMKHKKEPLATSLHNAVMALMLAANARNLMQNTTDKSCFSYFRDFLTFLREALTTEEYLNYVATPPEASETFSHALLHLADALSEFFFMRQETRQEMVEWIRRMIDKGNKGNVNQPGQVQKIEGKHSPLLIWNSLLDADEQIRSVLKHYPNGPLLKTLDVFRDGDKAFDPLIQENYPCQLFSFSSKDLHITCLRLPSPTHQERITEAKVTPEFQGFLRALNARYKGQKHLLINLQDRTTWHERARSLAVEELQKKAEFANSLVVVTLPKNTEFYLQSSNYLNVNQASEFLQQFLNQIKSGEECGFYFPPTLKKSEIISYAEKTIAMIHKIYFSAKNVLSRKNRLDFIEIFYLYFTLKLIDWTKPDSISFTCKDALDLGPAFSMELYAFLKLASTETPFTPEQKDLILWMLYTPALMIRERAIDLQRLNRAVSAISLIHAELEAERRKILETLPLKSLKVEEM